MHFATLIAVIAICRVSTGVLSDEIAIDPTDGVDDISQLDRASSRDAISKRAAEQGGTVSIHDTFDSKIKNLIVPGSIYNISQVNRVTKSFRSSKEAYFGPLASKSTDGRENNTQVQVHMEAFGNRLNKRKIGIVSSTPTLADPTNGYYVPPNIQNLYNGNQYNSNFNYRLSNQQTYGGNILGNYRFGRYSTNNFNRDNKNVPLGNSGSDKGLEAFTSSEGRLNHLENVKNSNSQSHQKEMLSSNGNLADNNKFVQNNVQYNPYSVAKVLNDQKPSTNSDGYNSNTNLTNHTSTTSSISSTVNPIFGDRIPSPKSTQANKRNTQTVTPTQPFSNYYQRNQNTKNSNELDSETKNFVESRSKKNIGGDKFIVSLYSSNSSENNTNSKNSFNGPLAPSSDESIKRKHTEQVYQFATTVATPIENSVNKQNEKQVNLENRSSQNGFLPFSQVRAYEIADNKPFQPNIIANSINNFSNTSPGPTYSGSKDNILLNNQVNNLVYYGAARTFNDITATTKEQIPNNHKPDDNKTRDPVFPDVGKSLPNLLPNSKNAQPSQNYINTQNVNQNYNGQNGNHNGNGPNNEQSLNHHENFNGQRFSQNNLNPPNYNQHLNQNNVNVQNLNQNYQNNPNLNPDTVNLAKFNQNVFNVPNLDQNNLNVANINQNGANVPNWNQNGFNRPNLNQNNDLLILNHNYLNQNGGNAPILPNQNNTNLPSSNQNDVNLQKANQNAPVCNQNNANGQTTCINNHYPATSQPALKQAPSTITFLDTNSVLVHNNGVPAPDNITLEGSNDLVVLNRTSRFLLNKPLPSTYYSLPKSPILPIIPFPPTSYSLPTLSTPVPPTFPTIPSLSFSPVTTKSVSSYDGFYGSVNNLNVFDVQVKDVMCYRSASNSKFFTSFTTSQYLLNSPVIEDTQKGVSCDVTQLDTFRYQIDFNSDDVMTACGIRNCGASESDGDLLCVTIRFPVTRGLRQLTDTVVTIQCKPLPASQSQTKQVSLKPVQKAKEARNLGALLSDLKPIEMHSDLLLYRKGPNGQFSKQISPGSGVELGEELQLKCNVRHGDGWVYSRMSDVKFHKNSHQAQSADEDTVVIVDDKGCTNPDMKTVCPHEQYRDIADPLSSALVLRTFMFQGMKDGDEMVISAKVMACVDPRDCSVDSSCAPSNSGWFPYGRKRRASPSSTHLGQNLMEDQETSVAFKIKLKSGEPCPNCVVLRNARALSAGWAIPVFIMSTVFILTIALVYLLVQMYKQERRYMGEWN